MTVDATAISVSVGTQTWFSSVPQWMWTLIGGFIVSLFIYYGTRKGWLDRGPLWNSFIVMLIIGVVWTVWEIYRLSTGAGTTSGGQILVVIIELIAGTITYVLTDEGIVPEIVSTIRGGA